MNSRTRTAFTLVEMLVVITIIAMLTAILVPAVQSAREAARRTTCMNNQQNIAKAISLYEGAKQQLPGYLNNITIPAYAGGGNAPVSWFAVLLPFLGRTDLWEGSEPAAHGWRTGNPSAQMTVRVGIAVCPDDASSSGVPAPLTYVVNTGVYGGGGGTDGNATAPVAPDPSFGPTNVNSRPPRSPPYSGADLGKDVPGPVLLPAGNSPGGLGVFRDNYTSTANFISMSDVKTATRTIMIGEKAFSLPAIPARQWAEPWAAENPAARLGFTWPNIWPRLYRPYEQPQTADSGLTYTNFVPTLTAPTAPLPSTMIGVPYTQGANKYWPPLPSCHPDVVIVTFCDGHTESLPSTTRCYNDPDHPALNVLP